MARIAAALIDDLQAFCGYKCKQSKVDSYNEAELIAARDEACSLRTYSAEQGDEEAQIIPYKHPRKWDYQLDQERKKSSAARAPNDAQKRQNDS